MRYQIRYYSPFESDMFMMSTADFPDREIAMTYLLSQPMAFGQKQYPVLTVEADQDAPYILHAYIGIEGLERVDDHEIS